LNDLPSQDLLMICQIRGSGNPGNGIGRFQPVPAPPPFDEANYLAALTRAAASEPALAYRCLAQLIGMRSSRRASGDLRIRGQR
jgi:hypothetical protein